MFQMGILVHIPHNFQVMSDSLIMIEATIYSEVIFQYLNIPNILTVSSFAEFYARKLKKNVSRFVDLLL